MQKHVLAKYVVTAVVCLSFPC